MYDNSRIRVGDDAPLAGANEPEVLPAIVDISPGALETPAWRRYYVPVRLKFVIALLLAAGWTGLSVWLSVPWLHDLSEVIGPVPAGVVITFIAYVPGFMSAFLLATILLDHRPRRTLAASYPGVTVLVACYDEAGNIADTLRSVALQTYPGPVEVLVLDDGSTDGTAEVAQGVIDQYRHVPNIAMRVVRSGANQGKAAALNRGLAQAAHDCIATIDGDSWLHATALQQIVERMISDPPRHARGRRCDPGPQLAQHLDHARQQRPAPVRLLLAALVRRGPARPAAAALPWGLDVPGGRGRRTPGRQRRRLARRAAAGGIGHEPGDGGGLALPRVLPSFDHPGRRRLRRRVPLPPVPARGHPRLLNLRRRRAAA